MIPLRWNTAERSKDSDMLKTILFDNDGVLVDTEGVFYEACRIMLKEFGTDLDERTFAEISMVQGKSLADMIMDLGYSAEIAEAAREKRNLIYDEMLAERGRSLVIPNVPEVLEKLHAHYKIGVVTCCQTMHFKRIHDASGLRQYFDFVVGDDDFTHHKPHPEPYLTALARSGFTAEEALAVEDSERGIISAKRAGITAAAIPRGISKYGNFALADHRFGSILELADFLIR